MIQYILNQLDDFLLYLQSNNYSQETVYNYERDLKIFEYFLNNEIKIEFSKLNKKDIEKYKAYLSSIDRKTMQGKISEKKLESFSINRILSSLRRYLKFLIKNGYESPLNPEHIELIKTEKKHIRVPELNDIIRLIESPSILEKNKLIAYRNRAILETLFSTGMRISELVNLKKEEIDKEGKIFIRGKGKKERFVYLTERAMRHIQEYKNLASQEPCSSASPQNKNLASQEPCFSATSSPQNQKISSISELKSKKESLNFCKAKIQGSASEASRSLYLFIPYRGKNNLKKDKKISTNYLQEKIKKYRELLGINVPISAHSIRHAFATYLAEKGANPAAIQTLLGHESLDTTTRYVNPSDRYAQETHKKYHPLN